MRLFESPEVFTTSDNPPGIGAIITRDFQLPVPRIGRIWSVDRVNVGIFASSIGNGFAGGTFTQTLQLYLNNSPFSDPIELTWQPDSTPSPIDITGQHPGITIQPFNSFDYYSKDILTLKVVNNYPGGTNINTMNFSLKPSVIGSNEAQ